MARKNLVITILSVLILFLQSINVWIIENEILTIIISLLFTSTIGSLGGDFLQYFDQDPMLGMILFGYLSKKLFPSIIITIPHSWTSVIWTLALSSVLCRAGLSLQTKKIVRYTTKITCLGCVPALVEATVIGFLVQKIFDLPINWAFTISFGVSSISPGVVVPLILKLLDTGWNESRIPPIMLTSLGIDVLISTAGFGIALSSCFGHGHEKELNWFHENWLTRAFEEVFIGLLVGFVMGYFSSLYLKYRIPDNISTFIMYITSSIAMIWCKTNDFIGAASFSTFITWGFVANTWEEVQIKKMDEKLKYFWILFKPYLFPVIGSTISFGGTSNLTIVKVSAVIIIALITKMLTAFIVCILCGFERSESLFVCGVWGGKASVQATLCGAALEMVHKNGMDNFKENEYAELVFLCLVCSVVLGAPFACNWVSYFGKSPLGLGKDEYHPLNEVWM